MATQVKRDSFARSSLMRQICDGECNWCGGKNAKGRVFFYYNEDDRVTYQPPRDTGKRFCCVGCYRDYYN